MPSPTKPFGHPGRLSHLFSLAVLIWPAVAWPQAGYLDNGVVRIGVDFTRGGAISYLSLSGSSDNVINVFDLGRHIQQSYYSGPSPFIPAGATQHPAYAGWGWNPVQAGDVYGYRSTVLQSSNDGTTLYVKCLPKQWALNNVNSQCTMESWITLDQNRVRVSNRLSNSRSDLTQYGASSQELPAIYTVGTLHKLYTYTGNQPFESQPVSQIVNSGPPWAGWSTHEYWVALVNDANWGLGVFVPGVTRIIGGFHGTPGIGNPYSVNTGYIAPIRPEILDHNIIYDFDYTLILGTLDEIRAYAYAHRPCETPSYIFSTNRRHFTYTNASDSGFPVNGCLRINTGQSGAQIVGPHSFWQAVDVPVVFVKAAFHTQRTAATLYFTEADGAYSSVRGVQIPIVPDGQVHTYGIDLSSHPLYVGPIGRLILAPPYPSSPTDSVDLYSIVGSAEHLIPADFDFDRDVDQEDFGRMQTCFTSGLDPPSVDCRVADLDGNDRVDDVDLAVLLSCFTGPGISSDPACAE